MGKLLVHAQSYPNHLHFLMALHFLLVPGLDFLSRQSSQIPNWSRLQNNSIHSVSPQIHLQKIILRKRVDVGPRRLCQQPIWLGAMVTIFALEGFSQ